MGKNARDSGQNIDYRYVKIEKQLASYEATLLLPYRIGLDVLF
jgi:hypothetical protein